VVCAQGSYPILLFGGRLHINPHSSVGAQYAEITCDGRPAPPRPALPCPARPSA
jgi:hypothetical protein